MAQRILNTLSHEEAITSPFSNTEEKVNKNWQMTPQLLKTWQHTPVGENWLSDNPHKMESQTKNRSSTTGCCFNQITWRGPAHFMIQNVLFCLPSGSEMVHSDSPWGVKQQCYEADYISPLSLEVKNDCSYTSTPPHTFMTYKGQLYLTFELHSSRG